MADLFGSQGIELPVAGGGLDLSAADEALAANAAARYAIAQTDDPDNREENDFYPTHPVGTLALLGVEQFTGPIWEPACGEGHISAVLKGAGFYVISTDLIDYGYGMAGVDFLTWPHGNGRAPTIITNPPFKRAEEFISQALMLTAEQGGQGKVAMFLRLAFLAGQRRGRWFPHTPLARVYVMSRRVPMQRGRLATDDDAGGMLDFIWAVWDWSHPIGQDPTIHFLDWKDYVT